MFGCTRYAGSTASSTCEAIGSVRHAPSVRELHKAEECVIIRFPATRERRVGHLLLTDSRVPGQRGQTKGEGGALQEATWRMRPCSPCNADICDGPAVVEHTPHGTLVHCACHVANVNSALVHVEPLCAGRLRAKRGTVTSKLTITVSQSPDVGKAVMQHAVGVDWELRWNFPGQGSKLS